jgi:anaerobic ribonucleoside-triphosphate reductase activating protein
MKLNIYKKVLSTSVLGKGKRFGLWLQGCKRKCFNCIAKDSWEINAGEDIDIEELAEEVNSLKGNIRGITISGGEPILQADALNEFLKLLNNELDVILYTGFKFEEIKDLEVIKRVDLLIDGEYIDELNNDTPLVGSINQRVFVLSKRGIELAEYMFSLKQREIEIEITPEGVFVIGIPSKNLKGII